MSEAERLAAVAATGLVGQLGSDRLERVVRQAAERLQMPMALLSLVGKDQQWNTATHGPVPRELPTKHSFCAAAITQAEGLVVPDLSADPAWAGNPLVAPEDGLRFYAGRPIADAAGQRLGTLCVLDTVPRKLDEDELRALTELAEWAQLEIAAMHVGAALEAGRRGTERAEELGALQDLLIAATGHDLRTPLTVVRAHAELLLGDPSITGPARESAEAILASALAMQERALALVEALRQASGGAEDALRARLELDRADGGQGTGR